MNQVFSAVVIHIITKTKQINVIPNDHMYAIASVTDTG